MTRQVEGTVRETPRKGSGSWMAKLPRRLSPSRAAIPGRWRTEREARRALNAAIADMDRGIAAIPGRTPGGPVRKVRHLVADYIEERKNDPQSPLAAATVRNYKLSLNNYITHPRANIGDVALNRLTTPMLNEWLGNLTRIGLGRPTIIYARRLVSAALSWEVEQGRLHSNPANAIRVRSTKASRAASQSADPVLVPTWEELTALVAHPERWEDRLLIATMAWCGLRWSEAVSLETTSLNPRRGTIAVTRVLTQSEGAWHQEAVKAGLADTVSCPEALMKALRKLAATRTEPASALGGNLLFRAPNFIEGGTGIVDDSNWRKDVWAGARAAAGLTGDPNAPAMDPRRRAIHVKDLRATTASVLVDAGATRFDAAAQLRHSDARTTDRYYTRALQDMHHSPARARIRLDVTLTLPERLSALFDAWIDTDRALLSERLLKQNGATFGATAQIAKAK